MKTYLTCLLLLLSCSLLARAEKPNVLFIAVDDLNDWIGVMGNHPDVKTPHMDKLASKGVVFNNAHCQFPVCGPSRASIFTGFRPDTTRILGNDADAKDENVQKLAAEMGSSLLFEYLANHGYKTMAKGKLLHHHVPDGSVDMSGGGAGFGPKKKDGNYNSKGTQTDWNRYPESDEKMPDYKSAAWAVERLQEKHEKPFMLMVGFMRPHVPWNVPPKWWEIYDDQDFALAPYKKDDLDDVPQMAIDTGILSFMPQTEALENDQLRNATQGYLASVSFVDHYIGEVLSALEKSDYKDNTIVILWSDHGYHVGEKGTFQKHSLWQRATHAPLIISTPGMTQLKFCQKPVELLDIYPTLLELCGLPPNNKNEGRSLVPLIKNPQADWDKVAITTYRKQAKHAKRTNTTYTETPSHAIFNERYHYNIYSDGSEELYDLKEDPNEWTNLASNPEYAGVKQALKKAFDQQMAGKH